MSRHIVVLVGSWLLFFSVGQCENRVQMPQSLQTINGSCVLIPCMFSIPSDKENNLRNTVTGVWRKTSQWFIGSVDVFNSSRTNNILHGKILGELTKKNCTSVLYNFTSSYSDKYFFRLETSSGFKFTFENSVQITANDLVPKPVVSVIPEHVMEGKIVTLKCAFSVPCPEYPPNVTWSPVLEDTAKANRKEILEKQEKGTFILYSELNFVASSHQKHFNCTAFYSLLSSKAQKVSQESISLNVTYAPHVMVQISPPGVLEEGQNYTLNCFVDANPPVSAVRWFRQTKENIYQMNVTDRHLTLTFSKETEGLYYCEAQNLHGTRNATIELPMLNTQYVYIICGISALIILLMMMVVIVIGVIRCRRSSKECLGKEVSPIYSNVPRPKMAKNKNNDEQHSVPAFKPDPIYSNKKIIKENNYTLHVMS